MNTLNDTSYQQHLDSRPVSHNHVARENPAETSVFDAMNECDSLIENTLYSNIAEKGC